MELCLFDTKNYERPFIQKYLQNQNVECQLIEEPLSLDNVNQSKGFDCICVFVNDRLDAEVIQALAANGVQLILLRCAGYNHIDLEACRALGLQVCYVPEYSPYAVAEFTMALILELSRKIFKSVYRTKDFDFHLDGLVGFDLNGKTVGVVGTGKIGSVLVKILNGFGCHVVACDPKPNPKLEGSCQYLGFEELLAASDIICLNVPLNSSTHHLMNKQSLAKMKKGSYLVNTGRGGLIDSVSLIKSIERGHLEGVALDVYELEQGVFFYDHSEKGIKDEVLKKLLQLPNVIISSHQAFLTSEALDAIFKSTFENLKRFNEKKPIKNNLIE